MENIVCKSCGGSVTRKGNYYICDFCRSKWMIDSGNDVHAVERTNAWEALRNNDFEKSAELFENIIGKDATNHEAFWGRALALNAITFVDDVHEGKKVPTCNNITENPFLKDKDVQKAISLAPEEIKVSYQAQAEQIEKIRMEWLNVASKEPPYDVFISYKDSDRERGIERTQDSEEAEKIYTELVEEGYKVFYSRRSLRDKVSERYEPYIYNAIKTAKVMIVFGRKPEYFTSTWIKNEWSRFRTRIEKGEKHKNSLVVVVNNMSPSDLPVALKSRQAMNMSDLTFLETLKKHIKRVIEESNKGVHLDKIEIKGGQIAKKAAKLEVNAVRTREIGAGATAQTDITELQTLSLADTYMKAGQWEDAAKLVDDVLFNNPSCAEALWKQILIGKRVADNTTLCLKINEITETDLQYVDKILNCAGQDMAMTLLDLFYDSCYRNMPDALYCQILKTILPYQYDNRGQKINDAFNWSVRNSQRRTFTILLTTLDSNDVETYIQYNYQFAKATKTNADKKECIDRIFKVDEGNIEALKMLLYVQLEDNEPSQTVINTFESVLKYSQDNRTEINEILTWLGKNLNSLDDCMLVKQVLRYSSDNISMWKTELLNLSAKMIRWGYFEDAEYLSKLILTFDALNPTVYWNICLIKVRATSEEDIKNSNIPLKQVSEYTKYLTLVDENRRQECIKLASTQVNNIQREECATIKKRKRKKQGIIACSIVAGLAVSIAVYFSVFHPMVKRSIYLNNGEFGKIVKMDNLTEYTIPHGVTSIGNSAFEDCSSLTSVVIPDGVTSIGDSAFRGCSSLTSITIPDSVTSIGDSAFNRCSSLTSIVIPHGVTNIGMYAFSYCSGLTSITLPDSVTSIGARAFNACDSLTEMTLPFLGETKDGTENTHFGYIFFGSSFSIYNSVPWSLKKVTITSATSIGEKAFYECNDLTSVVIPDTVTSIGDSAFEDCSSLTSVVIPDTVTSIGDAAFEDCSSLTSVVIPDGVTSIGDSAFRGCSSLTNITIPDSVTNIDDYAFGSCTSLTNVYITDIEAWCNISFGDFYANPLCKEASLYLNNELVTEITIPNTVTEIKAHAFQDCKSLIRVVIGNSVTSIGEEAFDNCSSLTSVVIGDNVTNIGGSAFSSCDNLTSVVIPDGVTSIGNWAFGSCDNLTSVVIPDSVTVVGYSVFRFCPSLTIYCEAKIEPTNWDSSWNPDKRPVVWEYKGKE